MQKMLLSAAVLSVFANMAHAEVYKLDPAHTNASFEINHFGASTNHGGFYNLEGSINYSAKTNKADLTVVIPVKSLNTGNDHFTGHIQSADLLNAEKFPTITFKSTKFNFDGKNVKSVEGNLTMLGKTHPVTLNADRFGCYESPMFDGAEVCGGDFSATIDRTQWGVNFLSGMGIPDQMTVKIQVEAVKQ